MPTMEVDGKKITFEGKKMILQACLDAGVELPHYCYHSGLSVVASCRICLVEAEHPNPKDPAQMIKIPKLIPSCQTPAMDGMKVYSKSPKAVANQKAVMEFLLINHPLDCPVCDQAGECFLQDYSYKYGRAESRFEEDKAKKPKKDIGPHVLLYSDRCIMCSRCVRFTQEISGTGELAVFGRGHKEEINVFQGRALDNPLSGNVVDICPVGALLDKDMLFTQRVWFLKSTVSISPFTSGGENIFIEHNQGRIYRIKPRFNGEINKWWISDDIRYGWKFVHENRLNQLEVRGRPEAAWETAEAHLEGMMRKAVAEKGSGSIALVLSAFDTTEEMYLAAKWIRGIDRQAWLVLNPPRVEGTDQTFKNPATGAVTYVIRAEKAPNRRGAEKIIAHFSGNTCDLAELAAKVTGGAFAAAVVVLDPIAGTDRAVETAMTGLDNVAVLSSRPTALTARASLVLPVCTWAEKDGVFENFAGRIQAFDRAIEPLENTRSAGSIFWSLLGESDTYRSQDGRSRMGGDGLVDYAGVRVPQHEKKVQLMEFSPL
jgi:NADH-quinone oxidoreductase subunit G